MIQKIVLIIPLILTAFSINLSAIDSTSNNSNYAIYDSTVINDMKVLVGNTVENALQIIWQKGYYFGGIGYLTEPPRYLSGIDIGLENLLGITFYLNNLNYIQNRYDENMNWDFNLAKKEIISRIEISQRITDSKGKRKNISIYYPEFKKETSK